MIFGQSVKSVLRTPLKSVLFILLIAAVTAFACLGFGMLSSGNRLIAAANETYTTKAVIEYIDEGYPDPGSYSTAMIEDLTNFDRTVLADNENVLSYETKYDVGGYIEGFRSKINSNTYGKYSVIRFRYRHDAEDPDYGQIVILDTYYLGDHTFHADSLLYIRHDAAFDLKEDHVYIAHGSVTRYEKYHSTDTFIVRPYINRSAPDDTFFSHPIWDITGLLDNEGYKQNERFSTFMKIVDSYNAMNNVVSVELTKDVKFATPFLLQQTSLLDDGVSRFFTQEEYDNSEKVIILSSFILGRSGKSIGDTVTVKLYPVNADGSFDKYAFWPDSSFAESGEYKIVGAFKQTSNTLNYTAFVPMPAGAEEWLPDNAISYTIGNVVLKNGTAEQYIRDIQPHLLEAMRVSIYDQGYSQTVAPLFAIRETAVLLSAVSAICCLVVLILFAYIFIAKQKDTAATMVSMGAGKRRALAYLLISVLMIALIASALGAFAGYRLSERVTTKAFEKAEQSIVIDTSFSAVYMSGDEVKFVPDFNPGIKPIAAVACAVVIVALLISLLVSSSAVKRSAPKLGRSYGEGLRRAAFALNLAVKSIFRGGAKNIIVPLVTLVLIVFIGIFAREIATSSDKLNDVYDNTEVYGYFTTFRGKQLDKLTIYDEQLEALKNDSHIDELYLSSNQYFDLIEYRKAGTDSWEPLSEPDEYYHYDPDSLINISTDPAENPYVDYDKIYYTESIAHTPEFLFRNAPIVEYLDGYSEESFMGKEYICAMPASYMEALGLKLGDEIKCFAKKRELQEGAVEPVYVKRDLELKIVASFEKASAKNNIYVPLYLRKNEYYLCEYYRDITWDGEVYHQLIQEKKQMNTPQEVLDSYKSYTYVDEGDLPYNSAAFKLKDLRTISDLKASLKEWGFSSVDGIGRQRIWVVIEDTFLNKSIENLNRHIAYMTILFIVVYLLALAIGFVLSYLLTKNRRSELAMMRSMGTGMIRTFIIFFLEQFILSLIGGVLGIIAVWLIYGEIVKLQWLGFAGYFICYWVGIIISTIIMNRVDVIKMLSAKD